MRAQRVLSTHGARSLRVALGLLQRRGFEAVDCLRGTGVSRADLDRAEARVSLGQELVFYRNVLALTGDPLIGLHIGAEYHLPNYGIWGYAVMSAANLGEALRFAFRFINLTYTCHDITLHPAGASTTMRLVPLRDFEDCTAVIADRDTSALFLIVSELLGRTLPLQKVELAHGENGAAASYAEHFGCPVAFGAPCNALHIASSLLGHALPHSNPYTTRMSEQQCEMLLAALKRGPGIVERLREAVLERPGHFPSIDEAAASLRMSARSLRRQLRDQGGSYSDVIAELRYQMAREYLEVTTLAVQEIAGVLGYSEPGNFSHAFKRWSGMSPNAYRARHRGAAGQDRASVDT